MERESILNILSWFIGLIVQWIEYGASDPEIQVRILVSPSKMIENKMIKINLLDTKFDKKIKGNFCDPALNLAFNIFSLGRWEKFLKKHNERYYIAKKEEWKKEKELYSKL